MNYGDEPETEEQGVKLAPRPMRAGQEVATLISVSEKEQEILRKAAAADPTFAAELKKYPINLQVGKMAMPVGAAAITGSITGVDIVGTDGNIVTSLTAGAHFDCFVHFNISNPGGGNWTIGVTVTATDGTNQHFDLYSVTLSNNQIDAFNIRDAINTVAPFLMPNAALNLRVTPWAYPYAWLSGAAGFLAAVPKSLW